jgi:hypothetical protein
VSKHIHGPTIGPHYTKAEVLSFGRAFFKFSSSAKKVEKLGLAYRFWFRKARIVCFVLEKVTVQDFMGFMNDLNLKHFVEALYTQLSAEVENPHFMMSLRELLRIIVRNFDIYSWPPLVWSFAGHHSPPIYGFLSPIKSVSQINCERNRGNV